MTTHRIPRILIAALHGGAGKTMVSIGLASAWSAQNKEVAVFKKGPDFIDASWLSTAAGRPCRNLDTYLAGEKAVHTSFVQHASGRDVAVIEGNRGLFDGIDASGTHSSARLARLLKSPVVLVLDCTKATRTVAASVVGCQRMDRRLMLKGVILNRHGAIVEQSVRECTGVSVVGSIPRGALPQLPERYLGLVPTQEYGNTEALIKATKESIEAFVNLEALWNIALEAPPLSAPPARSDHQSSAPTGKRVRIGVVMDSSFHFYYPENLEALEAQGAELLWISPSRDTQLPELDALYIGGGFPEQHAAALADNDAFKASVREAVDRGLPVYAECGGAMYLGKAIEAEGRLYPMAGILPVVFKMYPRPQGHGYTLLEVDEPNPYFEVGTTLKGHEFHYSRAVSQGATQLNLVCSVKKGHGVERGREGIVFKNVFATFSHVHAVGENRWAEALVRNALAYRRRELSHTSAANELHKEDAVGPDVA